MTGKLRKLGQAVVETLTGHWPEKYSPYKDASAEERKALDNAIEYFRVESGAFFDATAKPVFGTDMTELTQTQGQLVDVFSAALGYRNLKASPFNLFAPSIGEVTKNVQQAGDYAHARATILKGLGAV